MKIGELIDLTGDETMLGDILYYSRYIAKSLRADKMQYFLGHKLYTRYSWCIYDRVTRDLKLKRYENRKFNKNKG